MHATGHGDALLHKRECLQTCNVPIVWCFWSRSEEAVRDTPSSQSQLPFHVSICWDNISIAILEKWAGQGMILSVKELLYGSRLTK